MLNILKKVLFLCLQTLPTGEQQKCRNPCYTKMPKPLLGQSVENVLRKLQVSQKCRKLFTIIKTNKIWKILGQELLKQG